MIPAEDRARAVQLIEEAKAQGARLAKACEVLEIHVRTFKRWKAGKVRDLRKGAVKSVPRRLSTEERLAIIAICCSPDYRDLNPYEICALLLDRNIYKASISTFYRILRAQNLVHFRSNTRKGTKSYRPPERVATGPNQVWAWDITYLKSPVAGIYYYLYTVIDLWSRKIVGWQLDSRESAEVAEALFKSLMARFGLKHVYLHADNGTPMKAGTMLMTLYKLGIVPSYSRPRVSNDNAFIESFFKTLKYMRSYPKHFASMEDARYWVADFLDWYNNTHLHSAIGYVTPTQKHAGEATRIIAARNEVKRRAYEANKHRWSSTLALLPDPQTVVLNPAFEPR